MEILNLKQGSEEWLAVRAKYFTASEAPAMLGLSKYQTRSDLLKQKAMGITPDVDESTQRLFDAGHAAEARARPIAEDIAGDDFYPATGTLEVDGLQLLASFDGITMDDDVIWESKLWNEGFAQFIQDMEDAPDTHWPQIEQQLLISGADRALFTVTDGYEKTAYIWYRSRPERRAALIAGWKQFAVDLANYKHVEVIPAATAAPTLDLPAVSIQTSGAIAIISNLRAFGDALQGFIERLPTKPSTDQEFADCKAALAKLKTAEETLDSEEARALSSMSEIDQMRREKKMLQDLARTTRLALEKLVTARESAIKIEIMQEGKDKLAAHVAGLNKRLGRVLVPAVAADFAGAIKNKRTIESLRNAVDTCLANAKIAASEIADEIQINLATLDEHKPFAFLFSDLASLVMKSPEDLANVIKLRITEHAQAEEARAEKIRADERAKVEKEAADKARAEQLELAMIAA